MPRPGEIDTGGRKWQPVPYQSNMTTGSVQGVWLTTGEDVDWTWSADGMSIIGYTIKQKPVINPLTCPKCHTDLVHDENDAFNRCLGCGWYGKRT